MNMMKYAAEILEELGRSVEQIAEPEAETFADAILQKHKVFVAGAGRSGLMGRTFAMRLMQLGVNAYVVGDTVTPSIGKDDVLMIGTGSGETKSLIPVVQKAKSLGASVIAVTTAPESMIGKLADTLVKLPGTPKDQQDGGHSTIQPMASLFEQTLLIFYDAVILRMMELTGQDTATMYERHANLE
ncbi:6-phospho-3-hexuloisomerase [Paenibacillus sp. NFR01]|uniref:6-phospho-3-hexuloisomerase n=1 Tax=Paenibacillus sp. NFR01 TaxID=1566279 RepID=UPI0008C8CC9D|nr:6-phospho-3-hexuloisomerase [Paenibacillus sp. NFR01]SET25302.1 6-phospho-3-hexuloisomerase [Paenibacillus sp. NFR01]